MYRAWMNLLLTSLCVLAGFGFSPMKALAAPKQPAKVAPKKPVIPKGIEVIHVEGHAIPRDQPIDISNATATITFVTQPVNSEPACQVWFFNYKTGTPASIHQLPPCTATGPTMEEDLGGNMTKWTGAVPVWVEANPQNENNTVVVWALYQFGSGENVEFHYHRRYASFKANGSYHFTVNLSSDASDESSKAAVRVVPPKGAPPKVEGPRVTEGAIFELSDAKQFKLTITTTKHNGVPATRVYCKVVQDVLNARPMYYVEERGAGRARARVAADPQSPTRVWDFTLNREDFKVERSPRAPNNTLIVWATYQRAGELIHRQTTIRFACKGNPNAARPAQAGLKPRPKSSTPTANPGKPGSKTATPRKNN